MGKKAIPDNPADSTSDPEKLMSLIEDLQVQINQQQFSPEQIKALQTNLAQISAYSLGKVNDSFRTVFTDIKALIIPIDEKISLIKSQQNTVIRKEHIFSIDFRNSKAALTMISMALVILLSLGCHKWQFDRNWQLKDNDLKYRYIKSINGISSENLNKLERIFKYPRDKKKIEEIREKVEDYENKFKD